MPIFVGNSTVNTAVANSTITVDQTQSFAYATSNRNSIRPSLNLDFARSQTVDPRITFTRASSATYFNSLGVLTTAATNMPRIDYNPATGICNGLLIEESRTNSLKNNTATGAVVGTPGTVPTGWTFSNNISGLNYQIVSIGVENGITFLEARFYGTAAAGGVCGFVLGAITDIAALTGKAWTISSYTRISAGSTTNISGLALGIAEYTSASAFIVQSQSVQTSYTAATLAASRIAYSVTLSGGVTTAFIQPYIRFQVPAAGAVDITIRIGLPQLEQGAFATSAIATTNAASTRATDIASISIGTLFNPNAFSVYTENIMANITPTEYSRILVIDNGSSAVNSVQLLTTPTSNPPVRLYGFIGSTGSFPESGNSVLLYTANAIVEGALSVSSNNAYIAWNGANPVVNNNAYGTYTPSSFTTLWISAPISITGARTYCGWARKIVLWTQALSSTEIQTLTS